MHWTARYVGLPYVDGGRDRFGVDCWGLVYLAFPAEAGIAVPSYGEIAATELVAIAREIRSAKENGTWLPAIGAPRDFDLVLMAGDRVRDPERTQETRVDLHIGLCAMISGEQRILHVERKTHTVCVPVEHPSVRNRIREYWRHRELA